MISFNVKLGAAVVGVIVIGSMFTDEGLPLKPHVGYSMHCIEQAAYTAIRTGKRDPADLLGPTCRLAGKLAVWTEGEAAMERRAKEVALKMFRENAPALIGQALNSSGQFQQDDASE